MDTRFPRHGKHRKDSHSSVARRGASSETDVLFPRLPFDLFGDFPPGLSFGICHPGAGVSARTNAPSRYPLWFFYCVAKSRSRMALMKRRGEKMLWRGMA